MVELIPDTDFRLLSGPSHRDRTIIIRGDDE